MSINRPYKGKYSGSAGRNYGSSRLPLNRGGGGGGAKPPTGCGKKKTIVPLIMIILAPPIAFLAGLLGLGPDLI